MDRRNPDLQGCAQTPPSMEPRFRRSMPERRATLYLCDCPVASRDSPTHLSCVGWATASPLPDIPMSGATHKRRAQPTRLVIHFFVFDLHGLPSFFMTKKRKLITFDWAIKRLLRSKANFGILGGFLSELLKEDITILDVLDSERYKDCRVHEFNCIDLKVRNHKQEIIIIEIQYDREYDYLQRIFYGVSKTAIEHLEENKSYSGITKVISINILYFDLGSGTDYIYKGTTRFIGLHNHDILELNAKQKQLFKKDSVESLYPEYYLIKINRFNDIAKDTLDEWIYFLKNEEIKQILQTASE